MDPIKAVEICDSIPYSPYNSQQSECWEKAIALYPNVDMCSLSQQRDSQSSCIWLISLQYAYICEGKDHEASFNKKDDPDENQRLSDCWIEKTKIYPQINVCYEVYQWNKEKCMAARDSVPSTVERRNYFYPSSNPGY
jgi:hypothetical protein